MLELVLVASLGFLGSFGHCVGMCSPIAAAFALSQSASLPASGPAASDDAAAIARPKPWRSIGFHLLLNVGRILSYVAIGAIIGGLGSVLVASGQLAGVGSGLRRGMAIVTGLLLVGLGLAQIKPGWLPKLPFWHPLRLHRLHDRLSRGMVALSLDRKMGTPLLLGGLWGLIPCGFLYTAQIKAAETGDPKRGAAVMLAFGLGTLPTMLGAGVALGQLSGDRRSQLFKLGGWITLAIGLLTLGRSGNSMSDYSGHAALAGLMLALVARPLRQLWAAPFRFRRAIGLLAFALALMHTLHMVSHAWNWNFAALRFMLPSHQRAIWAGAIALLLLLPAALTSFDQAQRQLGGAWRRLHLLTVPALLLAVMHTLIIGSHYWGALSPTGWNQAAALGLLGLTIGVLLIRRRWAWALFSLQSRYTGATLHESQNYPKQN